MERIVFICVLFSLQYLGCFSEECPEFRKDVQWYGINGTDPITTKRYVKNPERCQEHCQDYSTWDDDNGSSWPCVGWTYYPYGIYYEYGTSFCQLFGNPPDGGLLMAHPIEGKSTGIVSGLKYDCSDIKRPTIKEILLEGIGSLRLNRTTWKYVLTEDTDTDKNGDISDKELVKRFEIYMGDLFKMIDQNQDGTVTEHELQSLRFDLSNAYKVLDAVLDNYPVKSVFFAADGNGDRVLDENDFKLPAKPFEGPLNLNSNESSGLLRLIGGKDSSSGDIFLGDKALFYPWPQQDYSDHNYQPYEQLWEEYWKQTELVGKVVCRELGFAGVINPTDIQFTRNVNPRPEKLGKWFKCRGDEEKLSDCQTGRRNGDDKYSDDLQQSVYCSKTGQENNNQDKFAQEITSWNSMDGYRWEVYGRFLFIADANEDGKLDLEEIKTKARKYLSTLFGFVDQTRDGYVSIKDFTSLQMFPEPIQDVIDILFDKKGSDIELEIDLLHPNIWGTDVPEEFFWNIWNIPLESYDMNNDTKLNADDFHLKFTNNLRDKSLNLIPLLSHKLDVNQDGKIQLMELQVFISTIFDKLKNSDNHITFEDIYKFLEQNGVPCLSVLEWRSFIPRFMKAIETQFEAMMSYLFKEMDEDRNGEIRLLEFQNLHIPCATWRKEMTLHRVRCNRVFRHFFNNIIKISFPPLPFSNRQYDEGNDLANAACKMLS